MKNIVTLLDAVKCNDKEEIDQPMNDFDTVFVANEEIAVVPEQKNEMKTKTCKHLMDMFT